eukprot:6213406-Pleurochrysis_carterae.AAC.2
MRHSMLLEVNRNQCHTLHYRGFAYQSSPSRQAEEIFVCDLQSRHNDNTSEERATKSKYNRDLHTECKKARCAKRVGVSTSYLTAPAAGVGASSLPLSAPLARGDVLKLCLFALLRLPRCWFYLEQSYFEISRRQLIYLNRMTALVLYATAVPRVTFSTPALAVPTSTAYAKACASLCDATLLTSHLVAVPYAWMTLLVAFTAVPSRTDSAFMQLTLCNPRP